jgi:hypothetical protein
VEHYKRLFEKICENDEKGELEKASIPEGFGGLVTKQN